MTDSDFQQEPTPDVPRGILYLSAVLAVIIAAVALWFVVQKLRVVGSAVKEDLQYVEELRSKDAETVAAQKAAGAEYMRNVSISLTAERLDTTDTPLRARLLGSITNSGPSDVILAKAAVVFYNDDPADPVDTREILLFNATDNSVRPDRPLTGSEVRPLDIFVEDVKPEWTTSNISVSISEVWISVPTTP